VNELPDQNLLEKYADVLISVGLNVQRNQPVTISAPIEAAHFARILMDRAYLAGASTVAIDWHDPLTKKLRLEKESETNVQDVPKWISQKALEQCTKNTAFLYIDAENPDLLSSVNPKQIASYSKAMSAALKDTKKYFMEDRVTWLVCSIPTKDWAIKMFPDESEVDALDKLWNTIFTVMRMDEADPVAAWRAHLELLEVRAEFLNQKHFQKLHYRAPGTNLFVELPPLHKWMAASSTNQQATPFVANMPTEEVYTLPQRDGVNGVLHSTMPLAYAGVVIEDLELTFEHGRIVNFSAAAGYEVVKGLIETDEGSHFLGEIALVPVDSPISKLNQLFYNTLFDENASCHVALGEAYPTCLVGGKSMSPDELRQNGANDSLEHVDFMIGSENLDIDGYLEDGTMIPIFRNGNWAL